MNPSVSVILPVRNAASTLDEQLDALGRQTYQGDWEILIALQPSDDGTEAVLARRTPDPRLRVIHAPERLGAGYARNRAAAEASAPLLAFCDADDVVDDRWLDALVSAGGDVRVGYTVPVSSGAPHNRLTIDRTVGYFPGVKLRFLPTAYTCNMVVRRELFERVGGFDLHFHRNHDVELSWRLQVAGAEILTTEEAIVFKRDRSSATGRWVQSFRWARYDPALYRLYRQHGMPSAPLRDAAHDWLWLVATAPVSWTRRIRPRWIDRSARRVGRIVGSVLERTAYL